MSGEVHTKRPGSIDNLLLLLLLRCDLASLASRGAAAGPQGSPLHQPTLKRATRERRGSRDRGGQHRDSSR